MYGYDNRPTRQEVEDSVKIVWECDKCGIDKK